MDMTTLFSGKTLAIAAAAVTLASSGYGGYRLGVHRAAIELAQADARHDQAMAAWAAEKTRLAEAVAAAERQAREIEQADQLRLIEAQNEAFVREARLRSEADSLRALHERMRDALATTRLYLSQATAAACPDIARASLDVFKQCTEKYSELAGDADRCLSDRQTLIEAWPR